MMRTFFLFFFPIKWNKKRKLREDMMVNENVARKNTWSRKLLLYTSISDITQIEQRKHNDDFFAHQSVKKMVIVAMKILKRSNENMH